MVAAPCVGHTPAQKGTLDYQVQQQTLLQATPTSRYRELHIHPLIPVESGISPIGPCVSSPMGGGSWSCSVEGASLIGEYPSLTQAIHHLPIRSPRVPC